MSMTKSIAQTEVALDISSLLAQTEISRIRSTYIQELFLKNPENVTTV
jgi:hypothetical protein